MLRPLAALGIAIGLLASPTAQAQRPLGDCISSGMITLGAFTAQYGANERGVDTNVTDYFVGLRANQALAVVNVTMAPASGVQGAMADGGLQLPVGQEIRVRLGRKSGPRLTDAELRGSLRVICRPA